MAEMALMAHLFRRAGFGATYSELETHVANGYEGTVETLLHPEDAPEWNDDLVRRYHVDQNSLMLIESSQSYWMYRMINTRRPLEEKIALFWHSLFATAYGKLNHAKAVVNQTNTFRRCGLGNFRDLLSELSRDPAMIFWLDNKDNHKDAPNENFGRELLELFSMGIGSYSEGDVKACARAFTGWTIANQDYMSVRASRDSIWPHGRLDWQFLYRPEDHDDGPKNFLGQTGRFNGEDILDIICQHPASSWFVATKLYTFFVSDVPNEASIQIIAEDLRRSGGEIRSALRTIFLSDFFRAPEARYAKVKSPAELVAGTARLAGSYQAPDWSIVNLTQDANFMGQEILNPPSVEGWHTGTEWVDTGTLVERVNSSALVIGDTIQPGIYQPGTHQPGVQAIIQRLSDRQKSYAPDELVDACLGLASGLEVAEKTRTELIAFVASQGDLRFEPKSDVACSQQRVVELLQLVLSTREYQMA
jgi:uncharacterized protein (DUF1800 family)